MSDFTRADDVADLFTGEVAPVPEPAADVEEAACYAPEGRDPAHDAEVFAHYAEGMAIAMDLAERGRQLARDRDARRAAVAPEEAAIRGCVAYEAELAGEECRAGRLPTMARPDGMSVEECERLARDGWGGGSLATVSQTQTLGTGTTTEQYTDTVKGSATILGVGTEGSIARMTQSAYARQDGRVAGTTRTTNDAPFPGYLKGCRDDARARFPRIGAAR